MRRRTDRHWEVLTSVSGTTLSFIYDPLYRCLLKSSILAPRDLISPPSLGVCCNYFEWFSALVIILRGHLMLAVFWMLFLVGWHLIKYLHVGGTIPPVMLTSFAIPFLKNPLPSQTRTSPFLLASATTFKSSMLIIGMKTQLYSPWVLGPFSAPSDAAQHHEPFSQPAESLLLSPECLCLHNQLVQNGNKRPDCEWKQRWQGQPPPRFVWFLVSQKWAEAYHFL